MPSENLSSYYYYHCYCNCYCSNCFSYYYYFIGKRTTVFSKDNTFCLIVGTKLSGFFWAGKVSGNKGTSITISSTTHNKKPWYGKILEIFFNFQEIAGEILLLHPASCCTPAVRKGNSWAIQSELLVRKMVLFNCI